MIALDDTCVSRHQRVGEAICAALREQARQLGFSEEAVAGIYWATLRFSVTQDPADGSDCLSGEWRDQHGSRVGQVQFNGDGSFFAEHDIVSAHPGDRRWFVEAVEAWGRDDRISTEPRLLAAV